MEKVIQQFIDAINAFDIDAALELFTDDAVIDDESVGESFKNTAGVRKYLDKFFVGYKTVTKLESIEVLDNWHIKAQVDFIGDFGHETGGLNFTFNTNGFINAINAYLD
ncbi:nuclear transport factor 2 family protein [Pedobacter cryoconitis]|uniref:Ketosteroid isomerase-like protein n=1 Tax=Pedobacter cryoconitis TaxID=188932 RepID=A0A7X0MGK5_9SPHI|nr:nuclear transport factor 2 family protein [Pedobacter cryoconitis]MBB6498184.1 ketosteroid isomerase-like protein [Pedobacter cryoconitis]